MSRYVPTLHTDAARRDALYAAQMADHGRIIPLADEDEPTTWEVDHAPAPARAAAADGGRRGAAA